tara:strand:+ start:758 stop:1075 length:318 start_codon:yes stop_codon:yes gene_type:complete
MEKSKIDRFIDAFRASMYQEFGVNEEGMVANAPGQSGGFSSSSAAKGPTAGFDPVMGEIERRPKPKIDGRRKYVKKYVDKLIKDRESRKEKKAKKNALKYNPYWK